MDIENECIVFGVEMVANNGERQQFYFTLRKYTVSHIPGRTAATYILCPRPGGLVMLQTRSEVK